MVSLLKVFIHSHTCSRINAHAHMHKHTHTHTHKHTHKHTHIHTHTHTQVSMRAASWCVRGCSSGTNSHFHTDTHASVSTQASSSWTRVSWMRGCSSATDTHTHTHTHTHRSRQGLQVRGREASLRQLAGHTRCEHGGRFFSQHGCESQRAS